jgi:NADH dehydrogenase
VIDMDGHGIELRHQDGRLERVAAATKIWAAGVEANPLGKTLSDQSGATQDRAGRIYVNTDLTLPGHPEVFVVGDMATLDNLPGVAQVAMQGGRYAAKSIHRRLTDKAPPPPFRYVDKGTMAIIGRFRAVGIVAGVRVSGLLAWLMWLGLHLFYITGFRSRVTAVVHWFVAFVGQGRSERTATEQQVLARTALQRARGRDTYVRT